MVIPIKLILAVEVTQSWQSFSLLSVVAYVVLFFSGDNAAMANHKFRMIMKMNSSIKKIMQMLQLLQWGTITA